MLPGCAILAALLGAGLGVPAPPAPPAAVPRTGQTACYESPGSAPVPCPGTGQDGDAAAGAPWPDPRFADEGPEAVLDRLTGLVWTRDADPAGGPRAWEEALEYVRALNRRRHLGHDDWRLPNVNELASLVSAQERPAAGLGARGFRNLRPDYYWTSTTYAAYPRCAWGVGLHVGTVAGRDKQERSFAWPVRGGGGGTVALPQTGQTACHDRSGAAVPCAGTGQDGESRAGVPWPSPRFVAGTDGTVADRLTGLEWSRDAFSPGPEACRPGARRILRGALDLVRCLNAGGYLGRGDWRLPNRNELASLVNRGAADSAAWLAAQGFSRVRPASTWTSTTYVPAPGNGWSVNLHDGALSTRAKTRAIGVWPVRGGR